MILNTLIEHQNKLVPAVVEIELIPGIPQIHFLGLPDKVIKESFFRIKAALKSAGFKFPISQQVIVNIRPTSLKKSSLGLELAVALGILHLTRQKELSQSLQEHIIYGELDLDGGVREPEDLAQFQANESLMILTGRNDKPTTLFSRLNHLNDDFHISSTQVSTIKPIRPEQGLKKLFSPEEAELIFLMATSRLHTLLAGQAGAGKSFLAKNYISYYEAETALIAKNWYPMINPHHSLTIGAFLGGGAQLLEGEIEKVENGVLILDELLEFHPQILEALREPMTGESLRIARASRVKEIKPEFQVVATSNFCICGKWFPKCEYKDCRYPAGQCKSYLNRLSGPLADRFGLMYFHKTKKPKREISGHEILKRIEKFKALAVQSKLKIDRDLIESQYEDLSGRRITALVKIAEIYAIEEQSLEITPALLKKSESWTVRGFLELEKGMC